jgi:hypothetical protein
MRNVLSRRMPAGSRVLLIESGSRSLLEGLLPLIRATWAGGYEFDLVTCYGGVPAALPENARVFRVGDYGTPERRRELIKELRARDYAYAGMICSAEPIMTKWKWMLALRVPAKFFIVNENGDYFWLCRENAESVRKFAFVRAGLQGADAARTLARLAIFPLAVLFLLLYALWAHAGRMMRTRAAFTSK